MLKRIGEAVVLVVALAVAVVVVATAADACSHPETIDWH